MTRVKRGKTSHKTREKILKQTKGFKWGRKSKEKAAKEALLHSLSNAFRGRKEKKRNFRRLWNVRINAALRQRNSKYSKFIQMLKEHNIELDRKVLSEIADKHPKIFDEILKKAMSVKEKPTKGDNSKEGGDKNEKVKNEKK